MIDVLAKLVCPIDYAFTGCGSGQGDFDAEVDVPGGAGTAGDLQSSDDESIYGSGKRSIHSQDLDAALEEELGHHDAFPADAPAPVGPIILDAAAGSLDPVPNVPLDIFVPDIVPRHRRTNSCVHG